MDEKGHVPQWRKSGKITGKTRLTRSPLYDVSNAIKQARTVNMSQHHEDQSNYDIFRDCVNGPIIQKLLIPLKRSVTSRKARGRKNAAAKLETVIDIEDNDTLDFAEFVDVRCWAFYQKYPAETSLELFQYLATEIFSSLPSELQTLSYQAIQDNPRHAQRYSDPIPSASLEPILAAIPLSISDSLQTYALLPDLASFPNLLASILNSYISSVIAPPPPWSSTRASACEICDRSWINLTYHHLIPKQVHAKAIKRGWHEEWRLNSVAWLCGACHRFVHRIADNEELAKEWWSVERLLEREDVRVWAEWAGRMRWKAK